MIDAAGVLFVADDKVLLIRRTEDGDHEGEWCFPGGKIEDGEDAQEAASRECGEEVGWIPGTLTLHSRRIKDGVDFTTYTAKSDEFEPELNSEHDQWYWATIGGEYPEPLHPGAKIALAKLTMDETQVAHLIVAGELTSPQMFQNIALFAMRITGTGIAYRSTGNEFVYRNPKIYLNDAFMARCNGLPVIVEHPEELKLNSDEFADRIVGTVMLPYLNHADGEVWGITRIYDDAMIDILCKQQLSTSPSVVFRNPSKDNTKLELDNGQTFLIEGKPALLDHLAICETGVWDKGGKPAGVLTITATIGGHDMADPEKEVPKEIAKKDAEGEGGGGGSSSGVDKILSILERLDGRISKLEGGGASEADSAKKDAAVGEGESMKVPGERADPDMSKETVSSTPSDVKSDEDKKAEDDKKKEEEAKDDKAKKDAADFEKWKDDRAKKDAETDDRVKKVEEKVDSEPSDDERAAMADAQTKCDALANAFGDHAPTPMRHETSLNYRRRAAKKYQAHSVLWKDEDLRALPPSVFTIAEQAIYADAMTAARNPRSAPDGELREVKRRDSTGRMISEFFGSPRAWMDEFSMTPYAVTKINTGKGE